VPNATPASTLAINDHYIIGGMMMRKYFEEYHSDEDDDYNPTKQE
jgi:hypothetical protein